MTIPEIRLLVADDQRSVRGNLKIILEAAGYRVDATGDSEEALARCHGQQYDIAFIDINMTKISGLNLVRYIRALSNRTTVVMLSQYGLMTKVVEAMKLGAVDYVEKPVDPRKLQLLCDEIIRRRQLAKNETVNELLRLAELALEQNTDMDARVYLKLAMLRDENRVEPYYNGSLSYAKIDVESARHCTILAERSKLGRRSRRAVMGFRLRQLATGAGTGNQRLSA